MRQRVYLCRGGGVQRSFEEVMSVGSGLSLVAPVVCCISLFIVISDEDEKRPTASGDDPMGDCLPAGVDTARLSTAPIGINQGYG